MISNTQATEKVSNSEDLLQKPVEKLATRGPWSGVDTERDAERLTRFESKMGTVIAQTKSSWDPFLTPACVWRWSNYGAIGAPEEKAALLADWFLRVGWVFCVSALDAVACISGRALLHLENFPFGGNWIFRNGKSLILLVFKQLWGFGETQKTL